jgi:hypothetical protein
VQFTPEGELISEPDFSNQISDELVNHSATRGEVYLSPVSSVRERVIRQRANEAANKSVQNPSIRFLSLLAFGSSWLYCKSRYVGLDGAACFAAVAQW